ncbi:MULTISPECIES: DUF3499 domain-containing protein [Glutamicibacter]|uniref:Uncharacterized protein DUF3499 n=1 Tax=Glutamicibacter mysorens TaxID=257984 RepID=A0ABX4MWE9_9MICC|nr:MULTISPECIES: DUF3499 domain-containing protein [Glutamicibacter]PJJ43065.1 uncharacterized protein DUF3499 [Glutamicibacter mysorens]UTM48128.1 DUF3499 domain-containing protein [Glutamicibacter mysorens]WIV44810.1 DUF3499 domain-containing protein [Glutamicibacter nicotianae]
MGSVEGLRLCSRPACREAARATLTYVYADSTAVLGPLATYPEPHCYDLCAQHANRLTVPSGWNLIRGAIPDVLEPEDELNALVNAVRDREPKVRQPRHASNSPIDSVRTRETSAQRFDSRVRLAVLPAADEES